MGGCKQVFIFGVGYAARVIAKTLYAEGYSVAGSTRDQEKIPQLQADGMAIRLFSGEKPMADAASALAGASHILISVQPDVGPAMSGADSVLRHHGGDIAALAGAQGSLRRIAYLSTTAVYGDQAGAWVDGKTPAAPRSRRAIARVAAEEAWADFAASAGVELDIFRLSGIYGPGRNAIAGLMAGKARRIVKPGQVFNRIHVDDIASCVAAGFANALPGTTYAVADNEPAPPQDVVAYAAGLCGLQPPPEEDFAAADMTPMARSFYSEPKRVNNTAMTLRLGIELKYPTYREGLEALFDDIGKKGGC